MASEAVERPIPSIAAKELRHSDSNTALAFAEKCLGEASQWKSELIKHRLTSGWQVDWKEEVGHWLLAAERHGFLDALLARVIKRARRGTRSVGLDPNDQRHIDLVAELAPAMVVYYLTGTGWTFSRWEPVTGSWELGDVDVEMKSPSGRSVNLQVKAPDQPGRHVDHQIVDGEYDDRIQEAVRKGAGQLVPFPDAANFVVVSPQRTRPLATNPSCLVTYLIGSTVGEAGVVSLWGSRRGWFFTPCWSHLTGVILLDYLRGLDTFSYPCTVLTNPTAQCKCPPDWFRHSRVVILDGDTFRWVRGEPGVAHTLPDGTRLDPSR